MPRYGKRSLFRGVLPAGSRDGKERKLMKNAKKWLALVVVCCVSVELSSIAQAETETVDGVTWTYTITNNSATVTKGPKSGVVTIPSTLGTYDVTCIGGGAFEYAEITAVSIPSSVIDIGYGAFYQCELLATVTIPDAVTSIGEAAFYQCYHLTEVTIGTCVTNIGRSAFARCDRLNAVNISDIGAWCKISFNGSSANPLCYAKHLYLNGEEVTDLTLPDSVSNIGEWAFYNYQGLTSVKIGSGVTNIAQTAFNNCPSTLFDTTTIPGTRLLDGWVIEGIQSFEGDLELTGIRGIADKAFLSCSGLTAVTLPDSVINIGDSAFFGCNGLTTVTIGKNVRHIGVAAFSGCNNLKEVHVANLPAWCNSTIGSFEANPLYYAHNLYVDDELLTEAIIPDGVTTINSFVFCGCTNLTTVNIPGSVTSIGSNAFYGCDGIVAATIPQAICSSQLSTIFPAAYPTIAVVTIGDGVTDIGNSTFAGCRGLTNVTISPDVARIGASAFSGCSGLSRITIPDSVTSIGADAFSGCSGLTAVDIQDLAAWCRISFEGNNANPLSQARHLYLNGAEVKNLAIPDDVTCLGKSTFAGCDGLLTATIHDNVTSIGKSAFEGCTDLTDVRIGKGVTSIEKDAFSSCEGLTKVHIADLAAWCGMDFEPKGSNPLCLAHNLYLGDEVLTEANIPDGVTTLRDWVFAGCTNLAELNIPDSVTNIAPCAFQDCCGITTVTIPQSVCASRLSSVFPDAYTTVESVTIREGVTDIGASAFARCQGLRSVTIPESVTNIAADAFAGCTNLNAVNIQNLAAWCRLSFKSANANPLCYAKHLYLNGAEVTELIVPEGVTGIGEFAFAGYANLTEVSIPDSVVNIASNAFQGCSGIRTVTLPQSVCESQLPSVFPASYSAIEAITIGESVTNIGASAFAGCLALTSVTIPDNVTSVAPDSFSGCNNLATVDIGNGVTEIGWLAGHSNLQEVVVGNNVKEIGGRLFAGCDKLSSVAIPEGIECIGDDAFEGCNMLERINLPSALTDWGLRSLPPAMRANLEYGEDGFMVVNGWVLGYRDGGASALSVPAGVVGIGNHAMADFWELASVELPVSLKYIGRGAFETNTYLDNVVIPDGVEWIRDGAFQVCTYMRNLTIGEHVGHIGRFAFAGCAQLATVAIPDSVEEMEDGVFSNCWRLLSVKLPLGLQKAGTGMFAGCKALTGVTMPAHAFPADRLFEERYAVLTSIAVIGGETEVCPYAFKGCSALSSVSLPQGLEKIGKGAFSDCRALAGLELPGAVKWIGANAFAGCSGLKAIVLPDSVLELGAEAFLNCTALANVTLSRSLGAIQDFTFKGCRKLPSMVVSASVTNLGKGIGEWFTGLYFLGNAPGYVAETYSPRSASVTTYVVQGSRGWDGIASSRDLPESWIGQPITFWTPNRFDAIFDANGGVFRDGGATYACEQITGVAYALPPYEPTLTGAEFDGWWTEPSEGAQITATTRVNETREITFYAHWKGEPIEVTVRFNANGGTVEPSEGKYLSTLAYETLPIPTRVHHQFTGWWTAPEGGNKVVASSRVPGADQELFAHWIPETYVIRYNANGGTGKMTDQAFTYGSPVTLRTNTFSRQGWDFVGWAVEEAGAVIYTDGQVFSGIAAVEDGVLRLFAVWHGQAYAVRFDSNGGTGHMDNQTFTIGEAQALSACAFGREKFRFAGWGTEPGGKVVYADGETVSGLTTQGDATVVLYAIWEAIPIGPLPEIESDEEVEEALSGAADLRLAVHILTAADYNEFRGWALRVKGSDGEASGAEAVLASAHAWSSYLLGAEKLFENEPVIVLGGGAEAGVRGTRAAGGGVFEVSVTVKDGDKTVAVDAGKVAGLFECTDDLGDWTGETALVPTVVFKSAEGETLLFEVTPGDGTATKAFLRIAE